MSVVTKKLLLDVGNTSLKWVSYCGRHLSAINAVKHQNNLREALRSTFIDHPKPEAVFVTNVMGDSISDQIRDYSTTEWGVPTHIIKTKVEGFGVKICYTDPNRLGVDRWLALIAARSFIKQTLLIVDSGSATTFDALSSSGEHLGGLILPGLEMMHESLLSKTSIPRVEFIDSKEVFASDTLGAVSAAAVHSSAALVDRLYLTLKNREDCAPQIILTGGNAAVIGAQILCKDELLYEPELVMKGLALIANSGDAE
jgi:type III pantothenate kinase